MSPPHLGGQEREPSPGHLHLQILGPLRLWRDDTEIDAGPRQQAYLLALLLANAGRPISTNDLIDLIWYDDAPATAANILQKYVGALRRLLEPALPVRGTGSYLLRRGDGYLFAARPGTVDVVAFREFVAAGQACLAEPWPDVALDCYVQALAVWHGPAGDGLAHRTTAMPLFAALDGEFLDACVAATHLAAAQGRPERVLAPLRLAARMAPLNETVQASLVTVLGAVGLQAEAVSVFETVRARLGTELGIDPGRALLTALRGVLGRAATPAAGVRPAGKTGWTAGRRAGGRAGRHPRPDRRPR